MTTNVSEETLNQTFLHIYGRTGGHLKREQITIIQSILQRQDTLNILPTGAGKSACYLVAGFLMEGVTLIITPLISLMRDQVFKIYDQVSTACLSSILMVEEDRRYRFLFVTPERLANGNFLRFALRTKISLLVVDEAHCVSLWGYDFRPSYSRIPLFLKRIHQRPTIAAFTATATVEIRRDILAFLDLKNPLCFPDEMVPSITPRENLIFRVQKIRPKRKGQDPEELRKEAILSECQQFDESESGLIYCPTVKQVNAYYEYLTGKGISATRYYAELDKEGTLNLSENESKDGNWAAFQNGDAKVMVCTNALGMGIDKGNISFVLHVGMPLCLENYYQEAGRAGRDGTEANCTVFYVKGADRKICEYLIEESLKKTAVPPLAQDIQRRKALDRLDEMERYCKESKPTEDTQGKIIEYLTKGEEGPLQAPREDPAERIRKEILKMNCQGNVLYISFAAVTWEIRKGQRKGEVSINAPGGVKKTIAYELDAPLSYQDMMVVDAEQVATLPALNEGRERFLLPASRRTGTGRKKRRGPLLPWGKNGTGYFFSRPSPLHSDRRTERSVSHLLL